MPRPKLVLSPDKPYHVMNRTNNKEFFRIPIGDLWQLFQKEFLRLKNEMDCQLICFTLMSNHYHLVLQTPTLNLAKAIGQMQSRLAKKVNLETGRINHLFGGRYKPCLINDEIYYWNTIRYVVQNSIRAGIVSNFEDYPYCSLNNDPYKLFKICQYSNYQNSVNLDREWLSDSVGTVDIGVIKTALRKNTFKIGKNQQGHRLTFTGPTFGLNLPKYK